MRMRILIQSQENFSIPDYQYLNKAKHPNIGFQCSVSENHYQYLRQSSVNPVQLRKRNIRSAVFSSLSVFPM